MNRTLPIIAAMLAVAGEGVAIAASSPGSARWNEAAVAVVVVAYAGVGLLILWHRPGQPVGRIAVTLAPFWGVGQALVATSYQSLTQHPDSRLAALASVVGGLLRGLPWLVAVLWLPLRFPDGERGRTRLHRVAERVSLVTLASFAIASLFPRPSRTFVSTESPTPWQRPVSSPLPPRRSLGSTWSWVPGPSGSRSGCSCRATAGEAR